MIEIIKAEEKHVPEIGKLLMEFMDYTTNIDSIFAPGHSFLPVIMEKDILPAMKSDKSLIIVALDDGKVIGYAYLMIKEPDVALNERKKYGYVHDLFITGEYRRTGIGEKMFDEIVKWFRSKDIDRIELDVIVKNRIAYSFWEKHGFTDYVHLLYRQI